MSNKDEAFRCKYCQAFFVNKSAFFTHQKGQHWEEMSNRTDVLSVMSDISASVAPPAAPSERQQVSRIPPTIINEGFRCKYCQSFFVEKKYFLKHQKDQHWEEMSNRSEALSVLSASGSQADYQREDSSMDQSTSGSSAIKKVFLPKAQDSVPQDPEAEERKERNYQKAFNHIRNLHGIFMEMPEIQICLQPLEEIQKVLVRNHDKFIFPQKYPQVQANPSSSPSPK